MFKSQIFHSFSFKVMSFYSRSSVVWLLLVSSKEDTWFSMLKWNWFPRPSRQGLKNTARHTSVTVNPRPQTTKSINCILPSEAEASSSFEHYDSSRSMRTAFMSWSPLDRKLVAQCLALPTYSSHVIATSDIRADALYLHHEIFTTPTVGCITKSLSYFITHHASWC